MENCSQKSKVGLVAAAIAALLMLGVAKVGNFPVAYVTDSPTITIAGATADTTSTPTISVHELHVVWTFGTIVGTYSTCTAQAKTTYDGTNFLTLGSAQSITVTSGTVNAWELYQVPPSASAAPTVVQSATSSTAALGFGQQTKFTFACSGYGTSAPVTITTIYR